MKILLIEDDTFFQHFYMLKLQEAKFDVMAASDGQEGLLKASEYLPDIILLDIIMPKKDGFEVLADLQKDMTLSKIPVLVFSTLGNEADVEKAKQLGAKDYVNKSFFDFESLVAKIQAVVQASTQ